MEVHLIDGTYELFRQFHGQKGHPRPDAHGHDVAAVTGVLSSVLTMIEEGATHLAVATDKKIESFRNDMWPTYKSSAGVPPELLAQFPVLEAGLESLGVALLAMEELEADDGLASAAAVAAADEEVERVLIWTPDKDLAQCVRAARVVQVDRRNKTVLDEPAILARYGVWPESIPDWLGLVGDSSDGFPGLRGWGRQSAAAVLRRYRHLEEIPLDPLTWDPAVRGSVRSAPTLCERLGDEWEAALLFRDLATLRVERGLVPDTGFFAWRGPTSSFAETARFLSAPRLRERAESLAAKV